MACRYVSILAVSAVSQARCAALALFFFELFLFELFLSLSTYMKSMHMMHAPRRHAAVQNNTKVLLYAASHTGQKLNRPIEYLHDLVCLGQGNAAQLDVGTCSDVCARAFTQLLQGVIKKAQLRTGQLAVWHLKQNEPRLRGIAQG